MGKTQRQEGTGACRLGGVAAKGKGQAVSAQLTLLRGREKSSLALMISRLMFAILRLQVHARVCVHARARGHARAEPF